MAIKFQETAAGCWYNYDEIFCYVSQNVSSYLTKSESKKSVAVDLYWHKKLIILGNSAFPGK